MTGITDSHVSNRTQDNRRSPRNSRGNGRSLRRSISSNSESSSPSRGSPHNRRGGSPCRKREVIAPQYSITPRERSSNLLKMQGEKFFTSYAVSEMPTKKMELEPPRGRPIAAGGQGTHHVRNARLRKPSKAEHLHLLAPSSGNGSPEEWLEQRKKKPAQAALFALMRMVAASESHLDEMRRRLMLCPAFSPERFFDLLRTNPNTPKTAAVSAEDLRHWLTKSSEFPIPVCGQDVEALIMRYSCGTELDLEGFLRIVTPRDWKESRDGPRDTMRRGMQSERGNAARASHAQASIRLAQLFERELQLIRDALARQHGLFTLRQYPADSLMLLGGTIGHNGSGGGLSLEGLQKRFGRIGEGSPFHLRLDEQKALVQHLSMTPGSEVVTTEQWDRFMRLGDQFTEVKSMDVRAFTKACRVCSTRIQRPYVACPDCGHKMYGPTSEFTQLYVPRRP